MARDRSSSFFSTIAIRNGLIQYENEKKNSLDLFIFLRLLLLLGHASAISGVHRWVEWKDGQERNNVYKH